MALGVTRTPAIDTVAGNKRVTFGTFAGDASYPTGGYPLSNRQLGLGIVDRLTMEPFLGFDGEYDAVNKKLKILLSTTRVEQTGGASMTTMTAAKWQAIGA